MLSDRGGTFLIRSRYQQDKHESNTLDELLWNIDAHGSENPRDQLKRDSVSAVARG